MSFRGAICPARLPLFNGERTLRGAESFVFMAVSRENAAGPTGLHSAKWMRLADINWRHGIMPKGMQRGNREAKKPKKDHTIPKAPVAGEGVVRPPAPVVADRHKRK